MTLSTVPVNPDEKTTTLPASYSRGILNKMKERQAEKGLANETIMRATGTPKTTFYRIWNSDEEDIRLDMDFVVRCCLFLGLSVDEHLRQPTDTSTANLPIRESSHEDVVGNVAEILNERKNQIEEQEDEIARLKAELAEKNALIYTLQKEHIQQITSLNAELKARHDQMHELSRAHVERVERFQAELTRRHDQYCDLLREYLSNK